MAEPRRPGRFVQIYEVGPRDGLQNEARPIATADKVRLIDLLGRVGFRTIEAASFVSPRWVPQMADATEVMAGIRRQPGTRYAALTPNLQGFERARAANVDEVAVFASASEGFSAKNINCSVAESLERFAPVCDAAVADGIPVRGYVSCVVACPYDGATAPARVAAVASHLVGLGCREVSLGDTIGVGTPDTVRPMLRAVLDELPASQVACHFHDSNGRALENVLAALDLGLCVFDASVGGAGGCPFAPGAAGNVATGAVVAAVEAAGFRTGLDHGLLADAEALIRDLLGRR